MVVDSVSELRLLAGNPLRYRRQILAMKPLLLATAGHGAIHGRSHGRRSDAHLRSLATASSAWNEQPPAYGTMRRRLHVDKMRGTTLREGFHDFVIRRGGIVVFPRLVAAEHRTERKRSR